MTKRFYPIQEKKEEDDNYKKRKPKNERERHIIGIIMSTIWVLFCTCGTIYTFINWKEYTTFSIACMAFALLGGYFLIHSLCDLKKQNYKVTLRTDETLVLYDDYLEYHYTEEDKDCIVSAKFKDIYADYQDCDAFGIYCSGSNIVLKHKKHNDCYAGYIIDETQQLKSVTIPSYFLGDNDLVKILMDKIH